jgi:hypothetical protein
MGESVVQLSIRQDEYAGVEIRQRKICDRILKNVLLTAGANAYGSSVRSELANFNKDVKAKDSDALVYGVKILLS